jgi:hypothetical protein
MRWVGLSFLGLLCAGLFGLAIMLSLEIVEFKAHAASVPGVITRYVTTTCSGKDSKNRERSYTCYQPVVSYELNGVRHESPVDREHTTTPEQDDKEVQLLVSLQAGAPEVRFAGFKLWAGPFTASFFGCAILAAVALSYALDRRDRKRRDRKFSRRSG